MSFASFSLSPKLLTSISKKLKILYVITILIILTTPTPIFAVRRLLSVPVPISPLENSLVTATNYTEGGYDYFFTSPPLAIPEFSWFPVAGANTYKIQISQNIGFNPVIIDATTFGTRYTPLSSNNLPDGYLYWRVRVETPIPVGEFSVPIRFTKNWNSPDNLPILGQPVDGSALDFYSQYIFSWSPVIGAARYRFQFASSPDGFSTPAYNITTLATTHQPPLKLANGTYYWRVIPMDPSDREGTPSETRQFSLSFGTAAYFPNEIPTLLEPADQSEPTFTPTFRWTAVRGAQFYRLQYTSDPTCNFGTAGLTTTVDTRLTTYTPTNALPNDINYCWHVSVYSGSSISDWSETWEFVKQWYIQAVPLTPVNNSLNVKSPFFSWSPVPGAAYYKIEISDASFPPPAPFGVTAFAVNPYFVKPDKDWSASPIWYWRVTPFDRNNNAGKPSDGYPYPNPVSFFSDYDSLVPHLDYPMYYYQPNNFPSPDESVVMHPHEDRSIPVPIFMWHRVIDMSGNEAANAYRIQVDDDPQFGSPAWQYDTENTAAVPSQTVPFSPSLEYNWRVCNLGSLGGNCISPWSQVWRTQFITPTLILTPTVQVNLLRPFHGSEIVEAMPLFEWMPVQGATHYQIQISQDPNFTTTTIDSTVDYPAYSPQVSLAQRSLNHLGYGTYYWHICALPLSICSPTWRFQLASQSQWHVARTLGAAENKLVIASDAYDQDNNSYELLNLYASQDKDYWYFGFDVNSGADAAYGLYLDMDHDDNDGATFDPRNFSVSTIPAHQPEYVIYLLQRGGSFTTDNVIIYRWTGSGWSPGSQTLTQVGGQLLYSAGYLEFRVPNTAIGMGEDTNSAAISLFSMNEQSQTVQDSVPASTNSTILDRFTSVSERMNLRTPPTNVTGDPRTYSAVPPFSFDYPMGTQWEGFNIQISLDPRFTTWVRDYILVGGPGATFMAPPFSVEHTKVMDIEGDNTYYWRIRPQYNHPISNVSGSWSQPARFDRQGFIPEGLTVTVPTLTFHWNMVEGAAYYDLQVDNDHNFGSPEFGTVPTAQNSYTPINNLVNGTYYWRVRVRRDSLDAGDNDWSAVQSFTVQVPSFTGLTPNDPDPNHVVQAAPTFCWNPIIINGSEGPLMSAWKYRIQVSKDSGFSAIFDTIDTEQSCWTPTKGYDDGTYYWHIAMLDGNGNLWQYSPRAQFTKQYPVVTPLSPANGAGTVSAPTFIWTWLFRANAYRLETSLYSTFSPVFESITTNNSRYTSTKKYDTTKTYYWRVAMIDRDGKIGPFTDAIILRPAKIYLPVALK